MLIFDSMLSLVLVPGPCKKDELLVNRGNFGPLSSSQIFRICIVIVANGRRLCGGCVFLFVCL